MVGQKSQEGIPCHAVSYRNIIMLSVIFYVLVDSCII